MVSIWMQTWKNSVSVDMSCFAVSAIVIALSTLQTPEGLMNDLVVHYILMYIIDNEFLLCHHIVSQP